MEYQRLKYVSLRNDSVKLLKMGYEDLIAAMDRLRRADYLKVALVALERAQTQ